MPKQLDFHFETGPLSGKTYSFKGRSVTIGSGPDNDLIIPDKYVGKLHAQVTVEAQGVVIQNKSVVGATFVNGERIERCLLNDGDQIAFGGGVALKFSTQEIQEGFQAPFRTPQATAFKLQVESGVLKWSVYEFSKDLVKIGSKRGSDLMLSESGVEEDHFQIVAEANDFVLYNESNSGVKVNGREVERRVLHDGDRIQLGEGTVLRFAEMLADVRLARPRGRHTDLGPLRDTRRKRSLFQNPLVVGGIAFYLVFLLLLAGALLSLDPAGEGELVHGGGFGYRSVARGILISKSIGQELYEFPVRIAGRVGSEEGYRVVSGKTLLFDSTHPARYSGASWPPSPPYHPRITSDPGESDRHLTLGRQFAKNRNISPTALFQTVHHLRTAEALCPRTDATRRSAVALELAEVEKALAAFYEDQWLEAHYRTRSRDYAGATQIYEFLRRLVPDETNPGNLYARTAQVRVTRQDP